MRITFCLIKLKDFGASRFLDVWVLIKVVPIQNYQKIHVLFCIGIIRCQTGSSDIYTQSQKKRTVESCVSFWEECRWMNFVVLFILPVLLVTTCKKPYYNITWNTAGLQNTPGFNSMHSWPKETHRLQRIPNLHWLQWDLSSFTNSKIWHTLGLFKISEEPFDIFE